MHSLNYQCISEHRSSFDWYHVSNVTFYKCIVTLRQAVVQPFFWLLSTWISLITYYIMVKNGEIFASIWHISWKEKYLAVDDFTRQYIVCSAVCSFINSLFHSSYSSGASQSQKKRLLAKAHSECMLGVATKREPGINDYHHPADYVHHSSCHSKEPALVASNSANTVAPGYHYVTTSSAGGHASTAGQEQHIVYTGYGNAVTPFLWFSSFTLSKY